MTKLAPANLDEGLLKRIKSHAPDLSVFGSHLNVNVDVRRFAGASILWLNQRWFAEAGVDLSIDTVRASVEAWLVSTYGVGIVGPHDPPDRYTGPPARLYADRYGSAIGSGHGGSGRVGRIDGFQAKGIGRTPLASPFTDWFHSNGCLWLEEGVREVIFSELGAAEFPHGAVPAIALIDTGDTYHWPDGNPGPHRAILVRADFARMAHLQRSIFFGDGGLPNSDQYEDALRTRDVWRCFSETDQHRQRAGIAVENLSETFSRIGAQHGYAHASRLWPGPFFSSNISLNGQIVDFGSMRALPSWRRVRGRTVGHGFGEEHLYVARNAHSLSRLSSKYAVLISSDDLMAHYQDGLAKGFNEALPLCDEVTRGQVREIFEAHQRQVASLSDSRGLDWKIQGDTSWDTAALKRFANPRVDLFYNTLVEQTMSMATSLTPGSTANGATVDAFIRKKLTFGRRHWRNLPKLFQINAQACDSHWCWLSGFDHSKNSRAVVLMGIVIEGHCQVGQNRFDINEVTYLPHRREGCWLILCLPRGKDGEVTIGRRTLMPPSELYYYEDGSQAKSAEARAP